METGKRVVHLHPISMNASYLDTPRGIFSAGGYWFRTTEALLREYATPVLEREPLDRLIEKAEQWLRSPATLTIWTLPVWLWSFGIVPAVLMAFGGYVLLAVWGPLLVSHRVSSVLRILGYVALQAVWYVVVLSYFALSGRLDLMAAGLVGFVVLRWSLVDLALRPVLDYVHRQLYTMPYPDQLLKSLIVRAALKYRIPLPEVEEIERSILNQIHRK